MGSWQYDPKKAQLDHKAQICAKFHKEKSKQKRDARPPPARLPDNFFPH